jgi:periplasmic protein TonB
VARNSAAARDLTDDEEPRDRLPPGTFGGFRYGQEERGRRQWLVAATSSSVIYVVIAVVAVTVGTATKAIVQEKKIDVTFVEKIVKPEPPPPPPPVPEVKPPPPAAAAPVVRPDQKIRKLDKPPPPKELVAPKEAPQEAPKEADPSEDKGIAVYGDGPGDPAGLEGGQAGGVAGGMVGGAIALPEDASPPMPAKSNAIPDYPQEARAAGKTGMVVLKVVILADGSVAQVQVMRGDEPFASAAVKAVKQWKYEPARYKGQAITVYRIIQIPFKLNV